MSAQHAVRPRGKVFPPRPEISPASIALAADTADVHAAWELDAQAGALFERYQIHVPPCRDGRMRTRGPLQEHLRTVARALPAVYAPAHVLAIQEAYDAADARYWSMVRRHVGIQCVSRRAFGRLFPELRSQEDAMLSIIQTGWYRAAMRWNPDEENGSNFPTYASSYANSALQRSSDRQTCVRTPRDDDNAKGGYTNVQTVSLDAPRKDSFDDADKSRFLDWQRDPAEDPTETIERAQQKAQLNRAISFLDERARTVVKLRMQDMSLAEVGAEIGCCRERVRQIEAAAMKVLRERLQPA